MKDTPAKMKEALLMAAEQFLKCEQLEKAVICLQNSGERELVAHLYEKMNQVICIVYLHFCKTFLLNFQQRG